MLNIYQVVDHNGKFAVKNLLDNSILKSKESGTIISFPTFKQAQHLKEFLDNQYNQIADASKFWWIKTTTPDGKLSMHKIEV
jgi:hypothetical protein